MKRFNQTIVLTLIITVLKAFQGFAQTGPEQDPSYFSDVQWQKTLSYDVITKIIYQFAPEANVAEIPSNEMIMLSPTTKVEKHHEYYSEEFKYIHEITKFKDTDYPSWMTVPRKMITTEYGIFLYGIAGDLIKHQEYDENFSQQHYDEKNLSASEEGLFPVPDFVSFDATYIQNMEQDGYEFYDDENGNLHFTKGQEEHIINPAEMYIAYIQYDEQMQEQYRMELTFYYNEYHKVVPKEQVIVDKLVTSNNVAYEKIEYTYYSNFTRGGSDTEYNTPVEEEYTTSDQQFGDAIIVYPNPASTMAFVQLPEATNEYNSNALIMLKELNGDVIDTQGAVENSTTEFNISSLSIGSYIFDISWETGFHKYIHFIKL